jgi:hypothetical protein
MDEYLFPCIWCRSANVGIKEILIPNDPNDDCVYVVLCANCGAASPVTDSAKETLNTYNALASMVDTMLAIIAANMQQAKNPHRSVSAA